MRFRKVLLVHPKITGIQYDYVVMPVGLGYISETLSQEKIVNKVIDLRFGYSFKHIANQITDFQPDLIGFTMVSLSCKEVYKLIKQIKEQYKYLPVVVGGPHVSLCMEKVLVDCDAIDYGVVREGEETIVELCKGQKAVEEIKGLIYRDGGEIRFTGYRELRKDIDNIPFPKYFCFETNKYTGYGATIPFITSRGCPFNCNFCIVKNVLGKRIRIRSAKSIVDEIEYWYRKGVRDYVINDDNFLCVKSRTLDFCKEIKKRRLKHIKIDIGNGVRADKINRDILKKLKKIGVWQLSIGVESANDHILKIIRKSEDMLTIEKAVSLACNLGFSVTLFFVLGTPGETEADVMKSISFVLKYPVADARMYNLLPLPGTELFEWVDKNNKFLCDKDDIIDNLPNWKKTPVFETDELPAEKRKTLLEIANLQFKQHTERTKIKFNQEMRRFHTATKIKLAYSNVLPFWTCYLFSYIYHKARLPKWLRSYVPLSSKLYLESLWRRVLRIHSSS